MKKQTYSEKLKSPKWQRKRLEILERDGWACGRCGNTETTLNVHHLEYHRDPWETPDKLLVTLCEICHNIVSEKNKVDNFIKCEIENILKVGTYDLKNITERKRLLWNCFSEILNNVGTLNVNMGPHFINIIDEILNISKLTLRGKNAKEIS